MATKRYKPEQILGPMMETPVYIKPMDSLTRMPWRIFLCPYGEVLTTGLSSTDNPYPHGQASSTFWK